MIDLFNFGFSHAEYNYRNGDNEIQSLKESVRRRILNEARLEFEAYGFMRANIRRIAEKSDISSGNIYNYYGSKDAIFTTIVEPTVSAIRLILDDLRSVDYLQRPESWTLEYHMGVVTAVADFIEKHRKNLELLAFSSAGSELEDFAEEIIDHYTEYSLGFISRARELYPQANITISEFFVHNIVSFYISTVREILMHRVSYTEMKEILSETMQFTYHGWKPLMDWYRFIPGGGE